MTVCRETSGEYLPYGPDRIRHRRRGGLASGEAPVSRRNEALAWVGAVIALVTVLAIYLLTLPARPL